MGKLPPLRRLVWYKHGQVAQGFLFFFILIFKLFLKFRLSLSIYINAVLFS